MSKWKGVILSLWVFIVTVKVQGGQAPGQCRKGENVMDCIFRVNQKDGNDDAFSLDKKVELLEGDIVWTNKLQANIEERKNKMRDGGLSAYEASVRGKWKDGIVPYAFARGFAYKRAVKQAIADFEKKTCIKFLPYTRARARAAGGYINFVHEGGCYSHVGRVGGKQRISLGTGCNYKSTAIHEMMHVLGFFHEQSRQDRDKHVTILWNNIKQGHWKNFEKYRIGQASTYDEPYDTKSLMHYGEKAFSKNGKKTIVSKVNSTETLGSSFGQNGMSKIDARQINKHYKCDEKKTKENLSCSNSYPFCPLLSGWCKTPWVKKNCKIACGLCSIKSAPCTDLDKGCANWERYGYCKKGNYVKWMKKNCRKSCKIC